MGVVAHPWGSTFTSSLLIPNRLGRDFRRKCNRLLSTATGTDVRTSLLKGRVWNGPVGHLGPSAPPHKSYGAYALVTAPYLLSPGTDLMNELCDRNPSSEFGHARVLRYILDGLSSAVAV